MANTRSYVVDIPGGTATTTVQIQAKGTLKRIALNAVAAAAGSYEVSLSATSQIGTAAPTKDVIARLRIAAATTGFASLVLDVSVPVVAFQSIYIHCTGAANVGEAVLLV